MRRGSADPHGRPALEAERLAAEHDGCEAHADGGSEREAEAGALAVAVAQHESDWHLVVRACARPDCAEVAGLGRGARAPGDLDARTAPARAQVADLRRPRPGEPAEPQGDDHL